MRCNVAFGSGWRERVKVCLMKEKKKKNGIMFWPACVIGGKEALTKRFKEIMI